MRKINIGAGTYWHKEGWEVLDNGGGSYNQPWKHFANAWDTKLPSDAFDIVYTSHTLEHVPHFLIEKAIAEFNRILKPGGILRISVPDLEKAARAYIANDVSFFKEIELHPADHLGIGSMFLNLIISPGKQTISANRDFEMIGSYAHTYAYDFEMLKRLVGKWGFGDIVRSAYGQSSVEELREPNTIAYKSERFPIEDEEVRKRLKPGSEYYITGFDNKPEYSLYIEAIKHEEVAYHPDKEFEYTRRNRFDDSEVWRIKSALARTGSRMVDRLFSLYQRITGR
ncbi:MAG: class I SAM-dependent methyltransferase [Desulfobacteraceae bacterium]|nr:MAG: class I SAM-dependent methyltransferase [Desulfobacteraceae bacterium]